MCLSNCGICDVILIKFLWDMINLIVLDEVIKFLWFKFVLSLDYL